MCCGQLLATRTITGVSAGDEAVHIALEPAPRSASAARRFIREHLGSTDPDLTETLLLLTSELVTNGILHARTGLELGAVAGHDAVLVTIGDDSSEIPTQPPTDHDRPSGRGLLLVSGLAKEWGVQQHADGKTVWFTLATTEQSAAEVGDG